MGTPANGRPSTAGHQPKKQEDEECCVCVAVNIRPLIEIELEQGCQEILAVTPGQPQVSTGQHNFTYDHVFGNGASDLGSLYPSCVQPLVEALFKGYNATVFAYGQTGSGKTYTMGSAFVPGGPTEGVIPNVMSDIYNRISQNRGTIDYTVRVSFVEINKEEVRDLLFVDNHAPRPVVTIRELPSGVVLAGAVEREVKSLPEMAMVLEQGSLCRATASTNMNNRSSRSHAIFTIILEQRQAAQAPSAAGASKEAGAESSGSDSDDDAADEAVDDYLIAKMHLVDLAGSERAKRTGAEGARLKEGININKGLLALAKVISALVDNQTHVPYRDSKLTRLLQDSLGGNSRTVMLACVSPADVNREETLNTLRYADRARHIRNKPVINRDPVAAQLAQLRQQLAQLRAENTALKRSAGLDPAAAFHANDGLSEAYESLELNYRKVEAENQRCKAELVSLKRAFAEVQDEKVQAEADRDIQRLRLQTLMSKATESSDESFKAAALQELANSDDTGVDIVSSLHGRISELETEVKQLRSLQRMTSNLIRGNSGSMGGASFEIDNTPGSPPLTPAMRTVDSLDSPLPEADVHKDAELVAGTAAHLMEQEQLKLRTSVMNRAILAKEKRLAALQSAVGNEGGLKTQYDKVLQQLQTERDTLQKERSSLVQKLQAVQAAGAEERKRLESQYKDKILAVEKRVKDLATKEREYKTNAKHLTRVEQVCKQLQVDINRMKSQRAAVQRRMEAKEKDYREWRQMKEKEVLQLRRTNQRTVAALQQQEAMHQKQQAVLKRKTEEADLARKRIRELLELQQRNRQARSEVTAGLEVQPNAGAPLLRSEKARRDWIEQELDLCNTSWEYQKVLDGEMAQRAEATRQIREVQKRLMLLGDMVPPSPLVSGSSLGLSGPVTPAGGNRKDALVTKKHRLEQEIQEHNAQIQELQVVWERTKSEEESKGGGAADVKRWTGVRNIIEARELLRSLFKAACDHKGQLHENQREIIRLNEELDQVRIELDMALQQAGAAKRHAVTMEATAIEATAMATPRRSIRPQVADAPPDSTDIEADELIKGLGLPVPVAREVPLADWAEDDRLTHRKQQPAVAGTSRAKQSSSNNSVKASAGSKAAGMLQLQQQFEATLAQLQQLPAAKRRSVGSEGRTAGGGGGASSKADAAAKELDFMQAESSNIDAPEGSSSQVGTRKHKHTLSYDGANTDADDDDDSPEYLDEDDDEDDDDDDPDWSIDKATPFAGRGRRRISDKQRLSSGSASSLDLGPGTSSRPNSAGAGNRSLTQQVSFNHQQRQSWEKPVMEHINMAAANEGRAKIDKLTVKVLKDALHGRLIDGKPWKPGCKTKDQLISDYRRWLQLPDKENMQTDINQLTGAASWRPSISTGGSDCSTAADAAAIEASTSSSPTRRVYPLKLPTVSSSPDPSPRGANGKGWGTARTAAGTAGATRRLVSPIQVAALKHPPLRQPMSAGTSPMGSPTGRDYRGALMMGAPQRVAPFGGGVSKSMDGPLRIGRGQAIPEIGTPPSSIKRSHSATSTPGLWSGGRPHSSTGRAEAASALKTALSAEALNLRYHDAPLMTRTSVDILSNPLEPGRLMSGRSKGHWR